MKGVELWHLTCVGNPAASASTEAHFRWKLSDAFVEGIIFFEEKLCMNQPGTDLAPFFMRTTSQSLWWSCASWQRRKAINSSIQLECLRTTNIPKPVRNIGRYNGDAYILALPNITYLNFGPTQQEWILDWSYKCCQIPVAGCAIESIGETNTAIFPTYIWYGRFFCLCVDFFG